MNKNQKIAILFFSRTAKADAAQKRWLSSKDKNLEIANTLIQHSQASLTKTGFEVYHFDQKKQVGETFGSKLSNAFQLLFNKGYEGVIAVGNDFIEWNSIDWQVISTKIHARIPVIGKTKRGGSYLIGLNRSNFEYNSFSSLPWQTNRLFESLCASFEDKKTTLFLLAEKEDVNTLQDIKNIIRAGLAQQYTALRILQGIISDGTVPQYFWLPLLVLHRVKTIIPRGPPQQFLYS